MLSEPCLRLGCALRHLLSRVCAWSPAPDEPSSLSPFETVALALVLTAAVLLVGALDYLTGHELNFYVFYFLPIGGAACWLGLRWALVLSALSAAAWSLADVAAREVVSPTQLGWNALVRLSSFVIIAAAMSRISALLAHERALRHSLEAALAEVKALKGLLPLCARCKQYRDPAGEWHAIDVYRRDHTHAEISHGLCPLCARLFLEEAGVTQEAPAEGAPPGAVAPAPGERPPT